MSRTIAKIGIVLPFKEGFGKTAVGLGQTNDGHSLLITVSGHGERSRKINLDASALEDV
jgi:hypothetical protein